MRLQRRVRPLPGTILGAAARRARWVGALGAVACLVGALTFCGQPATATSPGLNGRLVVAAGFDGDLWLGRPDGTRARQLTSGAAIDTCPAVSPSGLLIAFCRTNAGDGYDLWVMDADGANARQLTDFPEEPAPSAATDPTFSSSLPRLAFVFVRDFNSVGAVPGLTYDIRSIRSDGTGVRRLTRSAAWHDFHPAFSPGGHRLLWVRTGATQRNDNQTQLWIMRANGGHKRMVRSDVSGGRADWSPGGRLIVYRSGGALKIVRTDGTLARRIATRGSNPVWSPNGRWIAYRTGSRIELVSRDGSTTRSVTPFWGVGRSPLDDFAWQPLPQ
jgi:Tol biopolymer transport system component